MESDAVLLPSILTRDLEGRCRCSCDHMCDGCIYLRHISPSNPHLHFFHVVYCPPAFLRGKKPVSFPKTTDHSAALCSSLFTALAGDGGAVRSLPITDCHFDGDATGGESNSPSPSPETLFTPWKVTRPHQSTGTHTSMHACIDTRVHEARSPTSLRVRLSH